jgi:hypothetical protein
MACVEVIVPRVFAAAMAALGVFGLTAALVMLGQRLWRVLRGHTAMATVVDVETEFDAERKPLYALVVDFATRDGQRHTGVVLKDELGRKPRIGRRVRVIYRPGDPGWATVPMWFQTVVVLLGWVLFAWFAAGLVGAAFFGQDWLN